MRTLTRLSLHLSLLAFVAGPLLAACGDNLTPGGDIDANGGDDEPPDADTTTPDADTSPTVSATVAVFDSRLTDPEAAPLGGVRGGTIRMSFSDLTEGGGVEVFRGGAQAPIGSCLITKFDATHLPNPRLNAGAIDVSAPATGASALLKTVGQCSLQAPFGEPDPYVCISHSVTAGATVVATAASATTVAYTFPGVNFGMTDPTAIGGAVRGPAGALPANTVQITTTAPHGYSSGLFVTITGAGTFNTTGSPVQVTGANTFVFSQAGSFEVAGAGGTASQSTGQLIGSTLSINGFTNLAFNSGTSGFPIAAQANATTLVVVNSGPGVAGTTEGPIATGAYTVLNGFSPAPGTPFETGNFLGGSAAPITPASIRIQKAANDNWPAIDFVVDIPGEARRPVALTGVARAANVVTATTSVPHDFIAGQVLTIAGVPEVVTPTFTTSARLNDVVTVTIASGHGLVTGDTVTISGVTVETSFNGNFTVTRVDDNNFTYPLVGGAGTGVGGVATKTSFNGQHTVVAAPTATTFTYDQTASNRTAAGGTAVKPGAFTLDPTSAQPHTFPTTAALQTYSCDNDTTGAADDTCGDESSTSLKAMIISGSASKKSVAGLFPFQMPTEIPGTDEWLEWQCAYLVSKSGEMPVEAVQAILTFGPTRIEQQVLFVAGTLMDGPGTNNAGTGRILAGHAIAGHKTFCPAAAAIPPATITNISRTGNVVTVTTAAKHNFFQTQQVTIAGATDASFNGTFPITATPVTNGASTTFRYAQTAADVASAASAGTATVPTALSGFGPAAGPICPP